jgi:signal transduction histidine kinase
MKISPYSEVVREVLNQLDPRQKAVYSIEVQLPGEISVQADRQFLQQVLRNLFSNAFKYVPQKTPITLTALRIEASYQGKDAVASICVRVQDAGPGIPSAEQPLLFQKFTRLKRDLSGTVRGTGLGLHNCKKLVEAMGGQMWVESTGKPGEGSCFCFTLHEISSSPI